MREKWRHKTILSRWLLFEMIAEFPPQNSQENGLHFFGREFFHPHKFVLNPSVNQSAGIDYADVAGAKPFAGEDLGFGVTIRQAPWDYNTPF